MLCAYIFVEGTLVDDASKWSSPVSVQQVEVAHFCEKKRKKEKKKKKYTNITPMGEQHQEYYDRFTICEKKKNIFATLEITYLKRFFRFVKVPRGEFHIMPFTHDPVLYSESPLC
ncbi:hypothetical protein POVWA2_025750 [Plasmodium ovale wallikeri]|uniref:Uncharacterized protein n=1 Tax=Plasmodium ovale wallikeri TaxID=864142 RepID=A0A1A8YVN1_PLAOA|nr:hypothetical protein POVWA1_025920 [Plasmodium ovale wallikeri]SBT35590.1 hypothetical protein POVWA2_025750 [Plasmodium ovale wallikeri]